MDFNSDQFTDDINQNQFPGFEMNKIEYFTYFKVNILYFYPR